MKKLLGKVLFGMALLGPATVLHAVPITFDLQYSGIGNAATGVGSVTIDDAVLPNPGSLINVTSAALGVSGFSITIAGAGSGNGTFGLTDVTNWIWATSAPLNLTTQLVGQAGFSDFNWCVSLFTGCTAPAPGGTSAFTIRTNAEAGDFLSLRSMLARPVSVPEPTGLALFGIGLAGLALARRRFAR